MRALLMLAVAALPAAAQFQLLSLDGLGPQPVPELHDLGTVGRGETLSARYRIRNAGTASAPLRTLEVAGAGFSFAQTIALPLNMAPGASLDFTVLFRADAEGSYSAALRSEGVSALLTARVVAQLTLALDISTGAVPIATGATINSGVVERGSSGVVRLLIRNQTPRDQTVPSMSVAGDDFNLHNVPAGQVLRPLEDARAEVRFTPAAAAVRRGALTFGSRQFVLSGIGVEPPLPRPRISLALPDEVRSGQQGLVRVLLAETSRTSGRGTLTLTLRPRLAGATDPLAVLSNGGRTAEFDIASGDDRGYFGEQPAIGFQTGVTAGTLVFSIRMGEFTDEQTVEIAPAPPTISDVQGVRTSTGIEVRITGFDNTRTAGPLEFTFFDRTGSPVPPGPIRADCSADFGRYFQTSDAGGLFLLRAAFPVTGDTSAIDSVEVELSNASGATRSSRVKF